MIIVMNVRGLNLKEEARAKVVYCGRECAGWKGSPLGNPFVIGKDGNREQVIEKYRAWLKEIVRDGLKGKSSPAWIELLKIVERVKKGEDVVLGCWCNPLPCHAEVIRNAVLFLASRK